MILPLGPYKAALLDPPWSFLTYSEKGHTAKGAHGQYECRDLDWIKSLPVKSVCEKDSYVFMWATFPMLRQALDTLEAWEAEYVTGASWAKQSSTGRKWAFGTGYIFRSASELLLVGKFGKPKPMSKSTRNLIVAPTRGHSRKPDDQYAMVEDVAGPGRYLEVFARQSGRDGWDSCGDQADKFEMAQ